MAARGLCFTIVKINLSPTQNTCLFTDCNHATIAPPPPPPRLRRRGLPKRVYLRKLLPITDAVACGRVPPIPASAGPRQGRRIGASIERNTRQTRSGSDTVTGHDFPIASSPLACRARLGCWVRRLRPIARHTYGAVRRNPPPLRSTHRSTHQLPQTNARTRGFPLRSPGPAERRAWGVPSAHRAGADADADGDKAELWFVLVRRRLASRPDGVEREARQPRRVRVRLPSRRRRSGGPEVNVRTQVALEAPDIRLCRKWSANQPSACESACRAWPGQPRRRWRRGARCVSGMRFSSYKFLAVVT